MVLLHLRKQKDVWSLTQVESNFLPLRVINKCNSLFSDVVNTPILASRLWFRLVFLRRLKRMNACFNPKRKPSGTILYRKVKTFTLRGVVKKIRKWISISLLVTDRSLVNRRFMSNRKHKRNINRYCQEDRVERLKKCQEARNK